jgi:hypothetical protein
VGAAVCLVVACAPPGSRPTLDYTASFINESLIVAGTTDLPDGTQLVIDFELDSLARLIGSQETEVAAGAFEVSTSTQAWRSGDVTVFVDFAAGPWQPSAVTAIYGQEGQRLAGPDVVDDSGTPTLRVIRTFDFIAP